MDKPISRSFTIMGGLFFVVLMTLEKQGVLPAGVEDGVRSLGGTIVDLVEGLSLMAGLFGLRRAQGESIRAARAAIATLGRNGVAMFAVLFVSSSMLLAGCASYDAATVRGLADRNLARASNDECADFLRAAEALREGPDQAVKVIGRAGELERQADGMTDHALECLEVKGRALSAERAQRVRNAFDSSWRSVRDAVN